MGVGSIKNAMGALPLSSIDRLPDSKMEPGIRGWNHNGQPPVDSSHCRAVHTPIIAALCAFPPITWRFGSAFHWTTI